MPPAPERTPRRAVRVAAVAGVYAGLVLLLVLHQRGRVTPTVFVDELTYGRVALNLAHGAGFSFEGTDPNYLSAYPYLIAPALALWDSTAGYRAALVLNVLAMHLAIVPTYLLARRVASLGWALAAAAVAGLTPAMAWSGFLLTEAFAYPAAALALLAIVRTLARPTTGRALAAVGACALAALVRAQLFALFGVLALALVLALARDGPRGVRARLAELRAPAIVVGVVSVLGIALALTEARTAVLGTYGGVFERQVPLGELAQLAAKYVGVLAISALLAPLLAPLLLLAHREDREDGELGALLCVALAAVATFVAVGAWSSAVLSPELRERYIFYATPALAACWAALPGRASGRTMALATVVAFAYLLLVPSARATAEFTNPSVGDLIARLGAPRDVPLGGLNVWAASALVVGLATAAGLALRERPRLAAALIVAPTLAFGAGTLHVRQYDANADSRTLIQRWPQPPDWIDRSVDGDVAFLLSAGSDRFALWHLEVWNRRLTRVYRLPDRPGVSGVGQACPLEVDAGGRIAAPQPCAGRDLPRRLVVQDARAPLTLVGARLLRDGPGGMRLYELARDQAPRLAAPDARRVRAGARALAMAG